MPACDEGQGVLRVAIYGEDYVEVGIPAADTDGWAITFDEFLVHVSAVEVVSSDHEDNPLRQDTGLVFDLANPSEGAGHTLTENLVFAGAYDQTTYRINPATSTSEAGNVDAATLTFMRDSGHSVFAKGRATKGDTTVTFAWGFETNTLYAACESQARLSDGGRATVQLTIHADHFFYDDLVSKDPNVSFELIASADADANGEVTRAELEALDIRDQSNYQVGTQTAVTNLWAFISAQSRTLGHIDGEGHCDTE
jgi:hypothetical protein